MRCETLKGTVEIDLPYGTTQNDLGNGLRQLILNDIYDALSNVACRLEVNFKVDLDEKMEEN